MDEEFDGDDLVRLLRRHGGTAVADALVACSYYRTDPEALELITSCDEGAAMLIVRGSNGRERRVALAGGYVLSNDGRLAAAVQLLETDTDREQKRMEARLAAFGITARVEADDLNTICNALEALERAEVPGRSARGRIMALVEKYGSERTVLKFINSCIALTPGDQPIPGDVTIALVSVLRRLGDFDGALEATNTLLSHANGLSRAEQRILFTQRAAVWLDHYDLRPDRDVLKKARACADKSWAMGPSTECSLVYQRLKKLEADRADQQSAVETSKRKRSVAEAEAAWLRPKAAS